MFLLKMLIIRHQKKKKKKRRKETTPRLQQGTDERLFLDSQRGILKGVIKKRKSWMYFTTGVQIKMESAKPKRDERLSF